eukprot:gene23448-17320_t
MATKKMYDEELQVRLAMAGYHFDALVLRIIGLQHQAWDSPHFPTMARSARMENMQWLIREVTLPTLQDHVSTLVKWAIKSSKCMGFTTELLFVFMANLEAHERLLMAHPSASRLLVQRAVSTNDLEIEFSLVVNGGGYKP